MMKKFILMGIIALVFAGCEKNQPPTCKITSPQNGAEITVSPLANSIDVAVAAEDKDGTIAEVQLYINDVGIESETEWPYNFYPYVSRFTEGLNTIKAVAKDDKGATAESSIVITVVRTNN